MKVFKKFIILILILLIVPYSPVSTKEYDDNKIMFNVDNLSENKTQVWVFLKEIESNNIHLKLQDLNFNTNDYENKENFEEKIIPKIKNRAEKKYGSVKAHEPMCITSFDGINIANQYYSTMKDNKFNSDDYTFFDYELSLEIDDYLYSKRKIVKELCTNSIKQLIDKYNIDGNDIIYQGNYTSSIVLNLTCEQIKMISNDSNVANIELYSELNLKPEMYISSDQVGFTGDNGTSHDIPGTWMGHSGIGVNIGVLDGGMYDENAELLYGVSNIQYLTSNDSQPYIPADEDEAKHSTFVISMIKGKYYQNTFYVDNIAHTEYYEGHAKGANIYATDINSMGGLDNVFDAFVNNNVHIVNMSMSFAYDDDNNDLNRFYTSYDKEFDRFIKNTNIVLVVSAGKSQYDDEYNLLSNYVTSPGKALNTITVGAVDTKLASYIPIDPLWNICNFSSYVEDTYLPNKPDVVAPGEDIRVLYGQPYPLDGTSFSVPIVTSMIAQLMQGDQWLKLNPLAVKGVVMLSSSHSKLDNNGNSYVNYNNRDKSGAGFINASNAMSYIYDNDGYAVSNTPLLTNSTYISNPYYLVKGQKIRAIMVFNKNNDITINSYNTMDDLDFSLINSQGATIVSNPSQRNNTEVIEYIIQQTGYYRFKVEAKQIVDSNKTPNFNIIYNIN